ncbi:hypothetical protein M9435_004155 [Picochlorum sp. BPE23]|nr:hypothetical protein M9435_004155 [Picochlorum sp. BPE23]
MGKKKNSRCNRKSRRDEEEGVQDDLQEEEYSGLVDEALDMICDASKSKRLGGLAALEKYLLHHAGNAEIEKHENTLESVLFGCLRRGKVEERCKAATVLGLIVFHYGINDFTEEILEKMERYAARILSDVQKDDYSELIRSTAIIYFVLCDNPSDTFEFMRLLLSVADKGKSDSQRENALRCWTFLLIDIASFNLGGPEFVEEALKVMHRYLFHTESGVRLAAGEAITMLYSQYGLASLNSYESQDTSKQDDEAKSGLELILGRMKDIEKNIGETTRKSKKDRTEQRGEFKEFLKIIDGESPKQSKISLPNGQTLIVDTFSRIVQLNMLRLFLGSGFQGHLLHNALMHEIFDFEPLEFEAERTNSDEKKVRNKERNEERRLSSALKSSMIL